MLDRHYSQLLARLILVTDWNIELPDGFEGFFDETGPAPSAYFDLRRSGRVRVRTRGILIADGGVQLVSRERQPLGIFTADFSRQGFGFIADRQFYPTEQARILLPSFWMQVSVVRSRRLAENCFEHGAVLSKRCDPSLEAFEGIEVASAL